MTAVDPRTYIRTGTGTEVPLYSDYVRADQGGPAPAYLLERSPYRSEDYEVDASRYTSQVFFDLEVERLWPRVWQLACRANDVPNVGDYFEYTIVDASVLIVRSAPDTIKAFRNACRHRGSAIATGSGNVACFSCPFHGWTYGLDGKLNHVPAGWEFPHLESDAGLREVRVELIDGYVFINLKTDAEPLSDFLGETVRTHLPQTPDEDMYAIWHFEAVMPCNWKVGLEAFMEAYHVARTHPQLSAFVADVQAQYDSFGLHSRAITPFGVSAILAGSEFTQQEILDSLTEFSGLPEAVVPDDETARAVMSRTVRAMAEMFGIDLSRFSDSEVTDQIEYVIFPNSIIFRGAAGHQNFRFRPNGRDLNSCIFDVVFLVPGIEGVERPRDATIIRIPEGVRFQDFEPAANAMGVLAPVIDQDLFNFPLLQKGMHSAEKLVLGTNQEGNIVAFERNIDAWLSEQSRHGVS